MTPEGDLAPNRGATEPGQQPPTSSTPQPDTNLDPAVALRYMGLGFLLGAILAGALMWQLRRPAPPPIVLHPPPTAVPIPTLETLPTPTPGPLLVFVSGGVRSPGMYKLPTGARVGDALAAAGGLVADADPALVNQAEMVFDGAQIHVPLPQPLTGADASPEAQPPAGLSGDAPPAANASGASADGLININTASADELTALPGIGPSKAAAIIADRPYDSVEDLERISGIGPSTIETLTPLITTR